LNGARLSQPLATISCMHPARRRFTF